MSDVRLLCGDCLEILPTLPDGSVDMVLTDPPYGFEKTKAAWDSNAMPFDLGAFLTECQRVVKPRGAICVFAAPPFSAYLLLAGQAAYRYSWYYEKAMGANFGNSALQPLRVIEEILVFSRSIASANQYTNESDTMIYHPPRVRLQRPYVREDKPHHKRIASPSPSAAITTNRKSKRVYEFATPDNLIYGTTMGDERGLHPTQKPTTVCAYLIQTYTKPGDVVLDPFMGSGTTGAACLSTGRSFIGIEKHPPYHETAQQRLRQGRQMWIAL